MKDLNLPNQSEPVEGLICAGQPSAKQFREAASAGVELVVNLRANEETRPRDIEGEVREAGMKYLHLPVEGADDISEEKARQLAKAMNQVDGPVLVHCGSSNRVGALLALKAKIVDQMDDYDALEFGKKAGLGGLEAKVREIFEEDPHI